MSVLHFWSQLVSFTKGKTTIITTMMIMMEPSNNFFNRKISNGKLLCNFQLYGRTTQYRNNSFNKQPLFSGDDALTEFPGHTQKCILCLLTILLRAIASNLHFVVIFITAIYFFLRKRGPSDWWGNASYSKGPVCLSDWVRQERNYNFWSHRK